MVGSIFTRICGSWRSCNYVESWVLTPFLTFTNPNNDSFPPNLTKLKKHLHGFTRFMFRGYMQDTGLLGVSHVSNQGIMFPPSTMAIPVLSSKLQPWLNKGATPGVIINFERICHLSRVAGGEVQPYSKGDHWHRPFICWSIPRLGQDGICVTISQT
jgi:hypothetical protein